MNIITWIKNLFKKKEVVEIPKTIPEVISEYLDEIELYYTKRMIPNTDIALTLDVRDFVRPSYTIGKSKDLKSIWEERIIYTPDNYEINGVPDFWCFAEEVQILMKDDCDGSGTYRQVKATSSGFYEIFSCIGYLNEQGHFFNIIIDFEVLRTVGLEQSILIIENTTNEFKPIPYVGSNYKINYIFNHEHCWQYEDNAQLKKEFDLKRG